MRGAATQANAPYVLSQSGIPFIWLSSGTMGNNGALSAITALPTTYAGAWCLFPAGAIAAGVPAAAAWLWVTFSSTTAGTVWNSTYTSGPVTVGTQTAFATTGPGAFTGVTTGTVGPSITLPAGALGSNGQLRVRVDEQCTNNANAKSFNVSVGGANLGFATVTSTAAARAEYLFANRGASNAQVTSMLGWAYAATPLAATPSQTSVATASSQSITITGTHTTATDNIVVESFDMLASFAQ